MKRFVRILAGHPTTSKVLAAAVWMALLSGAGACIVPAGEEPAYPPPKVAAQKV